MVTIYAEVFGCPGKLLAEIRVNRSAGEGLFQLFADFIEVRIGGYCQSAGVIGTCLFPIFAPCSNYLFDRSTNSVFCGVIRFLLIHSHVIVEKADGSELVIFLHMLQTVFFLQFRSHVGTDFYKRFHRHRVPAVPYFLPYRMIAVPEGIAIDTGVKVSKCC